MYGIIEQYKKSKIEYNDGNSYGYCYVFYNRCTGLCKIGFTNNTHQRLVTLSCQSGVQLYQIIKIELSSSFDCTATYLETFLHRYFKSKRKIGEWFQLSLKDIIQIFWLFYFIDGDDLQYIDKDIALSLLHQPIPLFP
jgi:hypothetical protein